MQCKNTAKNRIQHKNAENHAQIATQFQDLDGALARCLRHSQVMVLLHEQVTMSNEPANGEMR